MNDMKNRNTFGIQFVLRMPKQQKNDAATIYARITVNGRRAEISLKSKVSVKNWDAAKEKAKGKRDEIARLNTHMKTVRVQLSDCYNQLVQKRKIVTVQVVKSLYLGEDAEETADDAADAETL